MSFTPRQPGWRYKRPFIQKAAARYVQQHPPEAPPPPEEAAAPPPPPPPVAPADDMSTKLTQLQTLGDLKAQGILTEEEFQAQKAAILNS
jgi:hypothetical protein